MLGKRFDRTMMASLAGVWVALAVSGCANVGQQGAQTGAASGASAASGVPAAAAAPASGALAGSSVQLAADDGTPLKKSPPLVYRVKRGDTLARIAQHHHCSVRQLQAWNGLKPSSRLKLGQVLHVASPETVRAVNAAMRRQRGGRCEGCGGVRAGCSACRAAGAGGNYLAGNGAVRHAITRAQRRRGTRSRAANFAGMRTACRWHGLRVAA